MIVACPDCLRRYRDPKPGFHCLCGTSSPLAVVRPFYPAIVRCAACGGNIDKNKGVCEYCGRTIAPFDEAAFNASFDERRYCISCFAYLEKGGNFCSACGARAIDPECLPLPDEMLCPRDSSKLLGLVLGNFSMAECSRCRGVWFAEDEFRRFIEESEKNPEPPQEKHDSPTHFDPRVRYVKCPICREQMARRNFEHVSGVVIDSCRDHGVWLDHNELSDLRAFLRRGPHPGAPRAKDPAP